MRLQLLESEAFPFGPGLFESFLLKDGVPTLFAAHWNRLTNSCNEFKFPFPFSFEETLEEMTRLADEQMKQNSKGRLIYKLEAETPKLGIQFSILKPLSESWSL